MDIFVVPTMSYYRIPKNLNPPTCTITDSIVTVCIGTYPDRIKMTFDRGILDIAYIDTVMSKITRMWQLDCETFIMFRDHENISTFKAFTTEEFLDYLNKDEKYK